jgi:hypothetical protein
VNLSKVVVGPFAVGTAFLLINRSTVHLLTDYYLTAHDWVDENLRMFSRLHVRRDSRETRAAAQEKLRRKNFDDQRFLRVFDYPVNDASFSWAKISVWAGS